MTETNEKCRETYAKIFREFNTEYCESTDLLLKKKQEKTIIGTKS